MFVFNLAHLMVNINFSVIFRYGLRTEHFPSQCLKSETFPKKGSDADVESNYTNPEKLKIRKLIEKTLNF